MIRTTLLLFSKTPRPRKNYLCRGNKEVWAVKIDEKYLSITPNDYKKYQVFTEGEFNGAIEELVDYANSNINIVGNIEAELAKTTFDEATTIEVLKEGSKTTYSFSMDEQKISMEVVYGLSTNLYLYGDETKEKMLFVSYTNGEKKVFPEHPSLEELELMED